MFFSCLFGGCVIIQVIPPTSLFLHASVSGHFLSQYAHFYLFCSPLFICAILQNDLDDPERGMIFVCSATHKTKSMFFFLAQTEQGDIFKVTLETDEEMVSKAERRKDKDLFLQ